jgi:putative Mg2+ transporter-C (MgtC) family protein
VVNTKNNGIFLPQFLEQLSQSTYSHMAVHLLAALLAGGLIGLERSYQGRAAGFRTHALVCMASSMLMLVTLYQQLWFGAPAETVRIDPTRMAQGVMTGIGFLGAGVIMKDGLSVRGLTTAASIWTTAAIGILVGVGLYGAAVMATAATIGVLSLFRWIENRLPSKTYADARVRFMAAQDPGYLGMREMLKSAGFKLSNLSYSMRDAGESYEYVLVVRTQQGDALEQMSLLLKHRPGVLSFEIQPRGD